MEPRGVHESLCWWRTEALPQRAEPSGWRSKVLAIGRAPKLQQPTMPSELQTGNLEWLEQMQR